MVKMKSLQERIHEYVVRHKLLDMDASDVPTLVMLSGGGDSVALLHLLTSGNDEITECVQPSTITVLHINHQLRGEESDADEVFSRELCKQLELPIVVRRIDAAGYAADNKLNLEDACRILRYKEAEKLLDELCKQQEVPSSSGHIVVAHTRDDRVENFFARAIYGSGLGALAGISPQRGRIIRPLLDIDRKELRDWLTAGKHQWREDPSNDDLSRTRAFIRARIVPEAEKLRPNFRENLARTMDLIADDDTLLSSMALDFARGFCLEREAGERIVLDARLLLTLDPVMARRTIRTAITETFDDASRLDASHVKAIMKGLDTLRQLLEADTGSHAKLRPAKVIFARDVPPALRVRLNYDTIEVARIRP